MGGGEITDTDLRESYANHFVTDTDQGTIVSKGRALTMLIHGDKVTYSVLCKSLGCTSKFTWTRDVRDPKLSFHKRERPSRETPLSWLDHMARTVDRMSVDRPSLDPPAGFTGAIQPLCGYLDTLQPTSEGSRRLESVRAALEFFGPRPTEPDQTVPIIGYVPIPEAVDKE
jgi:hypothetical protein